MYPHKYFIVTAEKRNQMCFERTFYFIRLETNVNTNIIYFMHHYLSVQISFLTPSKPNMISQEFVSIVTVFFHKNLYVVNRGRPIYRLADFIGWPILSANMSMAEIYWHWRKCHQFDADVIFFTVHTTVQQRTKIKKNSLVKLCLL